MAKYYEVVSRIYDDGSCECDEPRMIEAAEKPENSHDDGETFDTWVDYFDDVGEARDFAAGYKFA